MFGTFFAVFCIAMLFPVVKAFFKGLNEGIAEQEASTSPENSPEKSPEQGDKGEEEEVEIPMKRTDPPAKAAAACSVVRIKPGRVRLNEASVFLYFYPEDNRVRRVFVANAKKVKEALSLHHGFSRGQMRDLKISDFDSVQAIEERTRVEAIEYIKSVLMAPNAEMVSEKVSEALSGTKNVTVPDQKKLSIVPKGEPIKVLIGRLLAAEAAKYPLAKEGESGDSYVAKIETPSGRVVPMWGVDIEHALDKVGAKIGDNVSLVKWGKQLVKVVELDKRTKQPVEKEVLKNIFEASLV